MPDEGAVLYRRTPDATLQLLGGQQAQLSQLWAQRPLLVVFVFARCAGICTPLVLAVREATEVVGGAGETYDVLVLSFAPEETPEDLARFLHRVGMPTRNGWHFATAEPTALPQLLETVGFWYKPIQNSDQYDHPGMVVAIKDGRVLRVHVGMNFSPRILQAFLREFRGDRVLSYPQPDTRVAFRCYRYDPTTGTVQMDWGMLALLLPSMIGFSSAVMLFTLTRRLKRV
jgi:protein SCO1/2